jgi:hypothetical protein
MLTLYDPRRRYGRRQFLRISGASIGGLSLPGLFPAGTATAAMPDVSTGKSVILLFMHGGPSQTETFDPKMTALSEIRSATGEVQTKIPGVTFGGTFEKLAARADMLSVVRSFTTGDARHDIKPVVGRDTFGANLGSLYSRIVGTSHPATGMPTNAALFPRAIDPQTQPMVNSFGSFTATGSLGSGYAPFVPGSGGDLQSDMRLAISVARLDDRRLLLKRLDRMKEAADSAGQMDGLEHLRDQAFQTLAGGVTDAFDLSKEDPKLVERYDTAPLMRPDAISRKWNNYKNYVDNAKTLGRLLLLARRLCEAGCGFVTVTTNFVWDMHADVNNAGVAEGMQYMGVPFDHAVSTFLDDVAARGLSEKILLVATGEIGRTPRINKNGGRDHWGRLAPLLLSGGGLPMGHVIGQSTRDAGEPLTSPVTNQHLVSTIFHTLFDVSRLRLVQGLPTEILRAASDWKPIPGLA